MDQGFKTNNIFVLRYSILRLQRGHDETPATKTAAYNRLETPKKPIPSDAAAPEEDR
jgi:hypothetical protein